jgi:glycosyltransferase involved in cell wall biosynthesis
VRVSVAMCTWNRAASLGHALASMEKLVVPEEPGWEILVVNNACTDETDAVIARYAPRLPIRRLLEPQPGVSNARNCALDAVTGDLLVWVDDDCSVDPRWIGEYRAAAERYPEAAFFGGAIEASFESPPPLWLETEWSRVCDVYAVRSPERDGAPVEPSLLPFGANFAVRAEVQRRYRYLPSLGRRGDAMLGGEETEVMLRMLRDGHRGVWVPGARVQHRVTSDRLTEGYLRRFYHGQGQERAQRRGGAKIRSRAHLWTRALRAEARFRVARRLAPPAAWLPALKVAANRWGELSGTQSIRGQR